MRTALRVLLILSLPFIGALLGAAVGLATIDGRFERWQPLGQPPAAATDLMARPEGVWVTTASGQWYTRDPRQQCDLADCWTPASQPLLDADQDLSDPLEHCGPLPLISGVRVSSAHCQDDPLYQTLTVYALRPDGTVWMWSHSRDFELGPVLTMLGTTGLGLAVGFISLVVVMIITLVVEGVRLRRLRHARRVKTPPFA